MYFCFHSPQRISLEEFTALPPGEVDPEDAELDKEYMAEYVSYFLASFFVVVV